MDFKAKLRHLRISPKKVRLVIDTIRGQDVVTARQNLYFMPQAAARPVLKLLESAIANAKNNFSHLAVKPDENNLYIKTVTANAGPTLKRWRPRAFGRATPILKRSSHIELILAEKKPSKVKKTKQAKPTLPPVKTVQAGVREKEEVKDKKTPAVQAVEKPKSRFSKLTNFIRKTGAK